MNETDRLLTPPEAVERLLTAMAQQAVEDYRDARSRNLIDADGNFHAPGKQKRTWANERFRPNEARELSDFLRSDCVGTLFAALNLNVSGNQFRRMAGD